MGRMERETYFPHPAYELASIFEQHTPNLTRDDRYYAATQMQLDDWRLLARKFGTTLRREGDVRYALVILANRTEDHLPHTDAQPAPTDDVQQVVEAALNDGSPDA